MDGQNPDKISQCPVAGGGMNNIRTGSTANQDWWPNQLNLKVLHQNHPAEGPDADFDYRTAFAGLDLDAVKSDLTALMTDSQEWWPADYGHYGPFFIRMAWHSAGTYRVGDGRGGAGSGSQRFAPLNSWPDNGNLDKARRLLWPIKQKYGAALSWADLMILAGNVALESMGFKTFGFAGGREDIWSPEEDIYWGPETEWLGDQRYSGDRELAGDLGAVQMGLIYVNPEGPNGTPDPMASGRDIRETFARMAMNDEETVALVAGGHTFGKAHGAGDPAHVGREPEGAPVHEMGLGWKNAMGSGKGGETITSGLEGAWTHTPITWDMSYFDTLLGYEWELTHSPAGAQQWKPVGDTGAGSVPDAHDPNKSHQPMMSTADMALRTDPKYLEISKRFHANPDQFADAFARAWYKLTHRDMGPYIRGLGKEVPSEPLLWQDPVPAVDHPLVNSDDISTLKAEILATDLTPAALMRTAWAAAANYRKTDMRGGANGGRLALSPQKDWAANDPAELDKVLPVLKTLVDGFNAKGAAKISLADMIVLGGVAAVEAGAKAAGHAVDVPFEPGRTDATAQMTDGEAMEVLEPQFDGFRNYARPGEFRPTGELMIERAFMLGLSAPEMTVLFAGMRAMGATHGDSKTGVLTDTPGQLDNSVLVNLLSMDVEWTPTQDQLYEGRDARGAVKWTASAVDLMFGSNSQLRALAEYYASSDAGDKFVADFVAAWDRVMMNDRFDLQS